MSKHSRIRARKRALPDWVVDDLPESTGNSGTISVANNSDASGVTSPNEHQENDPSEKHDVSRKKKAFSRPKYEYLPGNKHSQQSQTGAPNPEVEDAPVMLTADEVVARAMPFIAFSGSVIYSYNIDDCTMLCDEIYETYLTGDNVGTISVGFDLEWPVTYVKGDSGKVALVQISTNETKCYLFHISAIGSLPKSLKRFIEDDRVKKIGVNIETDMWKLAKDFDFDARRVIKTSIVDLGKFANTKLKSRENWSLEGLCRNVLRLRMNKDTSVRCGKWDDFPLSDEQKQYAATDSYACLRIYNTLNKDT